MASAEPLNDLQLSVDEINYDDNHNYPFNGIHGVLHLLSVKDMKQLDDFEGNNYIYMLINVYIFRSNYSIVYAFINSFIHFLCFLQYIMCMTSYACLVCFILTFFTHQCFTFLQLSLLVFYPLCSCHFSSYINRYTDCYLYRYTDRYFCDTYSGGYIRKKGCIELYDGTIVQGKILFFHHYHQCYS